MSMFLTFQMKKAIQDDNDDAMLKLEREQDEIRAVLDSFRNELGRVVKSSGA